MLAYEEAVIAGALESGDLSGGFDPALGNADDPVGHALGEPERSVERDLESVEVAVVNTDHVRA